MNDDEDALFLLHRTILREFPQAVVIDRKDAQSALAFLKAQRVDAIITDNQMPGMDGLAMVRTIRAGDDTTLILMLTGSEQMKTAALTAGVNSFLSTGNWNEIRHMIRQMIPH